MEQKFSYFADLAAEAQVPENGILSRTLYQDDHVKVIVFGFAPGQELSAHTAPMAASLYFVTGEADLTLGNEKRDARPGTFVHMAPQLTHGIVAKSPVIMMLQMYKQAR